MTDLVLTEIADGIATLKVMKLKMTLAIGDWPLVNMWCPQTMKPSPAIAANEKTIGL